MQKLKAHVHARFEEDEIADLFDRMDWTVVSSPELQGVDKGLVQE